MRKRYLIFPLIMVGCLIGTICFAANAPKGQLEEETAVTAKLPEEKLKYPYSVEQAKKETKPEVTKAVTATPTPTPTPDPTPEPTPVVTEEPELTQTPENDEDAASVDVIAEEPQTEDVPVAEDAAPVIVEEPVVEEPVYDSDFEEPVDTGNYYEDLPDETSEVWQYEEQAADPGMQFYSAMTVTFYTRESVGYDAPGASGLGCVPGVTCAMPDMSLMGRTVYIEGFGTYLVTDRSPGGIIDIYLASNAEIPSYGTTVANVYLVG